MSYTTELDISKNSDTREIIEEIERLESIIEDSEDMTEVLEAKEEVKELQGIIDEIGREAKYGVHLIDENDFTDYCREMLEDCGDIPKDLPSYISIDWDDTAKNLEVDYSSIEINGTNYLYRA